MPPKGKAAPKPKANDPTPPTQTQQATTSAPPPPETIAARSAAFTAESRPFESAAAKSGIASLPRDAQAAWAALRFARSPAAARTRLPPKVQREYWKLVNESSLPIRALRKNYDYGAAGSYELARYDAWREKRTVLTCLEVQSREFRERRAREREGVRDRDTGETVVVTEGEIDEERRRRGEMAGLKRELYGVVSGPLEGNPEWDDVVPVAQEEPEGALATIAYPGEYAEAISYLRAVMIKKEYSARCLRLTERIIEMNPAHYTVWLYRAAIIFAMKLPILDEVAWLNEVSLEHLKNYQIWHHRHLLVDNYYPTIANDAEAVKAFGASEIAFLQQILREDTKNYHVWSYRSYLVEKLGLWDVPEELNAIERMIDDDVRNNSAWSHRFFLIFSNPKHSTKGVAATEHDPAAPADIVDREVAYAKEKIVLAPQNQSPWNYLRGVLVKGGRKLASVEEFVLGFMTRLGTESEDVTSSHALDLLAEIYAEKGDKVRAQLCLTRLAEKWDQIRAGYWEWRKKCLEKV